MMNAGLGYVSSSTQGSWRISWFPEGIIQPQLLRQIERRSGALIRFAKPGHTMSAWTAEKVANEVRFIEYLREYTTIPLPCIRCCGSADESPQQLGPYIIMDFIEGTRLSTFLKQPTEDDQADMILNPNIDEATLDTIYDQIADYMLQISRLEFPLIRPSPRTAL